MKVAPERVQAFLRRPEVSVVLLYGPDAGLVRERARALVAAAVDDPADPFRVVELSAAAVAKDAPLLVDEAAALALGGGRRAVCLRDASDAATPACETLLDGPAPESLVVVEAGDLGKRSSLRRLFEAAEGGAAVPCYADEDAGLEAVIVDILKGFELRPSAEALDYLARNLGADRAVTRNELEKLALYVGAPGTVSLDDARAAVGDSGADSRDGLAFSVGAGDRAGLELALSRAFNEGVSEVGVVRAVARHFQRLHLAVGLLGVGHSPAQAMAALRPPVFFKRQDAFRGQLRQWSVQRLAQALDRLTEAELDCKTSGRPTRATCGRALMHLAQAARRGGGPG